MIKKLTGCIVVATFLFGAVSAANEFNQPSEYPAVPGGGDTAAPNDKGSIDWSGSVDLPEPTEDDKCCGFTGWPWIWKPGSDQQQLDEHWKSGVPQQTH